MLRIKKKNLFTLSLVFTVLFGATIAALPKKASAIGYCSIVGEPSISISVAGQSFSSDGSITVAPGSVLSFHVDTYAEPSSPNSISYPGGSASYTGPSGYMGEGRDYTTSAVNSPGSIHVSLGQECIADPYPVDPIDVSVSINLAPPCTINSFSCDSTARLSWSTSNCSSRSINPSVGSVSASGNTVGNYNTSYTLSADSKTSTAVCPSQSFSGECGSSNNSCVKGTLSDTADTSTEYRWECLGSGGSNASCSLAKPATCGAATNSCAAGSLSDTADGSCTNNWQCIGSNTVSCSSAKSSTSGSCGASNNSCTAGTLSDTADTSTNYLWSCTGSCGGSTANCSAAKPVSTVNGSCGASTNTCSSGTFSDNVDSSCNNNWDCLGQNGGTNIFCSTSKSATNGVCGSSNNSCNDGSLSDTADTSTNYLWNCTGSCGGSTDYCSLPKASISVSLSASPTSMTLPNNSTTLTWTTTGSPTSCVASNYWSGAKSASGGSEVRTGMTAQTYTFTITCSKAGFTDVSSTATVTVNPSGPATCPAGPYSQTIVSDTATLMSGVPAVITTKHPAWATITGANWIWDRATASTDAPAGDFVFTRNFDIPSNVSSLGGSMTAAADNWFKCTLNGSVLPFAVTQAEGFTSGTMGAPATISSLPGLKTGTNTLSCTVRNTVASPNPAGFSYKITPTGNCSSCVAPSNFSPTGTINASTIDLSWDQSVGAVSYDPRINDNTDTTLRYDDTRYNSCYVHYYCENTLPAASICSGGRCTVTGIPVVAGHNYTVWVDSSCGTGSSSFTVSNPNQAVCDNQWRTLPVGGLTPSQPVITMLPAGSNTQYANSIGLFVRGTDNQGYFTTCAFNASNPCVWNPWQAVGFPDGGPITYSPATAYNPTDGWANFVRGSNGTASYYKSNISTGWWPGFSTYQYQGENAGYAYGQPFRINDSSGRVWQIRRNPGDSISYYCGNTPICEDLQLINSSYSPTTVSVGGSIAVSCDYGVAGLDNVNASIGGGGTCVWTGSGTGTSINFSCTATTPGTHNVSCLLGAGGNLTTCGRSDIVGTLTVPAPVVATADIKANGSDGPITIPWGGTADITWTSSNATGCRVDPPVWTDLNVSAGKYVMTLTQPVNTYRIYCDPPAGGSEDDSVTVNVEAPLINYNLYVIKSGQGTVSNNPAGTSCGLNCSAHPKDTSVQLTATASPGRIFTGWTGCDEGTAQRAADGLSGTCTVTMTQPKTVYANFAVGPDYSEF